MFHKILSTLPNELEPNAVYYIRVDEGVEQYIVDMTGQYAHKVTDFLYRNQIKLLGEIVKTKVDNNTFNTHVNEVNDSITNINNSLSNKVNVSTYTSNNTSLNQAINSKLDSSVYNQDKPTFATQTDITTVLTKCVNNTLRNRDVTSSRTFGVEYTNNNPYPIYVNITLTTLMNYSVGLLVDGLVIDQAVRTGNTAGTESPQLKGFIPPGSKYKITNLDNRNDYTSSMWKRWIEFG